MLNEITREMLEDLYIKGNKSTHEIARILRFFDQNFFKISNRLSLDLHTTNLLDPISQQLITPTPSIY